MGFSGRLQSFLFLMFLFKESYALNLLLIVLKIEAGIYALNLLPLYLNSKPKKSMG